MSQENFEELMNEVIKGVALHLLEIGSNDPGGKSFDTCRSGELMHLRVKNSKNEVCFQVSGKETGELAHELVLACLHATSIEQLCAMHKQPLKRALQVQKGKK